MWVMGGMEVISLIGIALVQRMTDFLQQYLIVASLRDAECGCILSPHPEATGFGNCFACTVLLKFSLFEAVEKSVICYTRAIGIMN